MQRISNKIQNVIICFEIQKNNHYNILHVLKIIKTLLKHYKFHAYWNFWNLANSEFKFSDADLAWAKCIGSMMALRSDNEMHPEIRRWALQIYTYIYICIYTQTCIYVYTFCIRRQTDYAEIREYARANRYYPTEIESIHCASRFLLFYIQNSVFYLFRM